MQWDSIQLMTLAAKIKTRVLMHVADKDRALLKGPSEYKVANHHSAMLDCLENMALDISDDPKFLDACGFPVFELKGK